MIQYVQYISHYWRDSMMLFVLWLWKFLLCFTSKTRRKKPWSFSFPNFPDARWASCCPVCSVWPVGPSSPHGPPPPGIARWRWRRRPASGRWGWSRSSTSSGSQRCTEKIWGQNTLPSEIWFVFFYKENLSIFWKTRASLTSLVSFRSSTESKLSWRGITTFKNKNHF